MAGMKHGMKHGSTMQGEERPSPEAHCSPHLPCDTQHKAGAHGTESCTYLQGADTHTHTSLGSVVGLSDSGRRPCLIDKQAQTKATCRHSCTMHSCTHACMHACMHACLPAHVHEREHAHMRAYKPKRTQTGFTRFLLLAQVAMPGC